MGPAKGWGVWFGFPALLKTCQRLFCSTRLLPESYTQPAKRLAGAAAGGEDGGC